MHAMYLFRLCPRLRVDRDQQLHINHRLEGPRIQADIHASCSYLQTDVYAAGTLAGVPHAQAR
eukprot:951527-Pleurochrysis_carterae.AAC.1